MEDKDETAEVKKRAIPEMRIETDLLYRRLAKMQQGDVATYEELKRIAGVGVSADEPGYPFLMSARRKVLHDHRIVIEVVSGEGVKRLNDIEIVNLSGSIRSKISRTARKGQRKLTSVQDFDGLPREKKLEHNAALSQLGAIRLFSAAKATDKILEAVEEANDKLAVGNTLKLFER